MINLYHFNATQDVLVSLIWEVWTSKAVYPIQSRWSFPATITKIVEISRAWSDCIPSWYICCSLLLFYIVVHNINFNVIGSQKSVNVLFPSSDFTIGINSISGQYFMEDTMLCYKIPGNLIKYLIVYWLSFIKYNLGLILFYFFVHRTIERPFLCLL